MISKTIGRINKFFEIASSLVLLATLVMTCVDVVGRYFFNSPLQGATELTELAIALIVFFVFPVVCYQRKHVSIDILDSYFPKRFEFARDAVTNVLIAASLFYLSVQIFNLAARAAKRNESTEMLSLEIYPLFYGIGVFCLIGGVFTFLCIFFPDTETKSNELNSYD